MKFHIKTSPLLILLLPSIATALAAPGANVASRDASAADIEALAADSAGTGTAKGRHGAPTRDAPVDGKDGKPHLGPFVGADTAVDTGSQDLPPLKGRPNDPTVVDGKKIPESNDGVMFDKNRERPQEGTTGTEGGVSEKSKQRKALEGKTGAKVLAQPEPPKAQPPLPHSVPHVEEPQAQADKVLNKEDSTEYTGLDKPGDLPEKSHEFTPPVPDSAKKDHLDISKPKTDSKPPTMPGDDEADSIIQPFHSFVLSFTMILVSEVGDKTFLVAALMAMKHDRMVVFSAAFGALLVMTVLSAVLGHAVPVLIPKRITSFLASALFFVFGARLLREGMAMDPNEGVTAEMHEVEQELAEKEKELGRNQGNGVSPYALEMGLEGGRHSRSKSRISTPPRSPSESPQRGHGGSNALAGMVQGASNLCSLLLSPAWVQTFIMTFLGEWGDRSQIATIAMAAGQDYWWVTLGAMCGHAICTGVAVVGGRAIAGRVSLKVVTVGGAIAFLVFGFIYLFESFYA